MTGKEAGPARLESHGRNLEILYIGDVKICDYDDTIGGDCLGSLNRALAPLVRKAALCERMACALRTIAGNTNQEDSAKVLQSIAKMALVEYDREGRDERPIR